VARAPIRGDEQRRTVTVLFADIVGFTSLAERLDPEEVRDVTAAVFGRLVEEIVRRGGTVDKFIGDAVMALFGTPVAHEDDACRAVEAALAMQAALGEINGDLERIHGLHLELRIGINTGEVVAGVREVGGFQDDTVIGDTVNTASRLQTAADPGSVLVGDVTSRLSRQQFELEALPPLLLRGKSEPVQAYRALGPLTAVPVADAATVPLVGRAVERAVLAERVAQLDAGLGSVVIITGEPGTGKSRLLTELRQVVERHPHIRIGEAHAAPYGPGQTPRMYAPWAWAFFAEQLTELAAVRGSDPTAPADPDPADLVAATLERLQARLDALGVPEALPFLCYLLDLPRLGTLAAVDDLSPEELHRRSLRAITKLHVQLASEGPCVIVVDDLHWAGPSILSFMEAAAELAAHAPLLLVLSFRADVDAPSWALREHAQRVAPDRYVELALGPLGQDDSRQLARTLLGGAAIDADAEALLMARIDGNPLYAYELIQAMVDRGALTIKSGRVKLDEDATRRIPETLQAMILSRIDRLPEEARRVVQTGAVLGRTFSRQLLTRVFGDGPALERGLRDALRAGILVERFMPSRPGYTFTQGLAQEVAERTLLLRRRRELHRQALEAIEAIFPDELGAHAPGLTRHALGAEAWGPAARYALLAGERAASDYSTREALRFYDLGLEAVARLGDHVPALVTCRLLAGKALMLANLGQYDDSVAALQSALVLARAPGFVTEARELANLEPRRLRARLALRLAGICAYQTDLETAEAATAEAFSQLDEADPEMAGALAVQSWLLTHRGKLQESADAARASLRAALANGGFEERARAYDALTRPEIAGEIGPGIATYAAEAIRLARENRHDGFLFKALIAREVLREICLQPYTPESLMTAHEILDLAQRMDSVPAEGTARVILGVVCLSAGLWDEAERELTSRAASECTVTAAAVMRNIALVRLLGARGRFDEAGAILAAIDPCPFSHGAVWLGITRAMHLLTAGDPEGAHAVVMECIDIQANMRCLACEAILGGAGAEIMAGAGDNHRAAALADRADAAGDGAFVAGRLMAARARMTIALNAEMWDAAIAYGLGARALADEVGQPFERARYLLLLGTAYHRRGAPGDAEHAQALFADASRTFSEVGAQPYLARLSAEGVEVDARPATVTR